MSSLTQECKRSNGSKNLKVQFEDPLVQEIPNHQKPSSLSASDSSLDSTITDGDIPSEDYEKDVSELDRSMLLPDGSCPSPVWSFQGGSVTQSSSNQTTSRPAGYDPNRIPASIFSSKPATEWSLASNESLFSIQLGNNSFSRDHVLMLNKCGDLSKFEDFNTVQSTSASVREISNVDVKNNSKLEKKKHAGLAKTLELPAVDVENPAESDKASSENDGLSVDLKSQVTETSTSVSTDSKTAETLTFGVGVGDQSEHKEISKHAMKSAMKKNPEEMVEVRRGSTEVSTSVSYRSESNTSTQSFCFPTLGGGSGRTSSDTVSLQPQQFQEHMQPQNMERENLQNPENLPKIARSTWFSCISCKSPCY